MKQRSILSQPRFLLFLFCCCFVFVFFFFPFFTTCLSYLVEYFYLSVPHRWSRIHAWYVWSGDRSITVSTTLQSSLGRYSKKKKKSKTIIQKFKIQNPIQSDSIQSDSIQSNFFNAIFFFFPFFLSC